MSSCLGLELPPIDGDRHLCVGSLFLFVEVPWLAVAFVALGAQPVEVVLWMANKVCAVVQVLLARAAQTKLGDVPLLLGFFVFVRIAPLNLGLGLIPACVVLFFLRVSPVVFVIIPTAMFKWCILAAPFPCGFLLALRPCSCSRSPAGSRVCDCRHLFVRSLECTWSLHSTTPLKSISISFSINRKYKTAHFSQGAEPHVNPPEPTALRLHLLNKIWKRILFAAG